MIIEILFLIVGFFFLVKGADLLVDGASSLARKIGASELIIGLTIVALGTSLPELIVNVFAAFQGSSDLALGNVIGSNIANTLLILGTGALFYSIKVQKNTIYKEIPFNLLAVLALAVIANDVYFNSVESQITRSDGIILLLFFAIFIYYLFEIAKSTKTIVKDDKTKSSKIITMIGIGAAGLFIGGKLVVDGAVSIAQSLGMSEFLISATIIAFGTSLPELVTTVSAALKKNVDILVGNIVGSNILNILLVLGLTAVINPIAVPDIVSWDILFLMFATFGLFSLLLKGDSELRKGHGVLFVGAYIGYIVLIVLRG